MEYAIWLAMPNYRRAYIPDGSWFFTVNLLEQRKTLLTDHVDSLRRAVSLTRPNLPFAIDAFVVLPDHLHAIRTLPPGDADFSARWRLIKTHFAKALPKQEHLSPVRIERNERGIWQRRLSEHLIRDEADYARHVEYCYINPVSMVWSNAFATGRTRRFIVTSMPGSSRSIGPAKLIRAVRSGSGESRLGERWRITLRCSALHEVSTNFAN
jgi:putative transposase